MHQSSAIDDMHLPDEVIHALRSAADDVQTSETWIPERQGLLAGLLPRAIRLVINAIDHLPPEAMPRRMIRQNTLRFLSYVRADLRLGTLLELAMEAPDALRDLLAGDIDEEYAPYRYNIHVLAGLFARHGLVQGILRTDRLKRVDGAMLQARAIRSGQQTKEERT